MERIPIPTKGRLYSLLDKYNISVELSQNTTWNSLIKNPIRRSDIDRLVYVMGIRGDSRIIKPKDRHARPNRYF